ncbi:MAG: hypothetical protein IJ809_07250 [Clostridia bacterium]|nr:hypothetical protein [Clostridia bacterium]
MKLLVDYRMKDIFLNYFINQEIEIVKVKCKDVYAEVSGHPDIFFTNINGKLVVAKNVNIVPKISSGILGESVEKGYPATAKYNVCVNNKYIICNYKYVSEEVKKLAKKENLEVINVKQGYTRCSALSLDENNYITIDLGIKKQLEKRNMNVLYVEEKNVKLLGSGGKYSSMQGFLAGSLAILKNEVILFGDKDKLKNGRQIEEFVEKLGYKFIDFKNEDVIDYGSVICIDE